MPGGVDRGDRMLAFLLTLQQFWRALRYALRDPEFRSLALFVVVMIAVGAVFYHNVEGWGWLDSIYFCVITLATVGYGDFSPHTPLGKVFTIFYIVLGLGLVVAVATRLADALLTERRENQAARQRRLEARQRARDERKPQA